MYLQMRLFTRGSRPRFDTLAVRRIPLQLFRCRATTIGDIVVECVDARTRGRKFRRLEQKLGIGVAFRPRPLLTLGNGEGRLARGKVRRFALARSLLSDRYSNYTSLESRDAAKKLRAPSRCQCHRRSRRARATLFRSTISIYDQSPSSNWIPQRG